MTYYSFEMVSYDRFKFDGQNGFLNFFKILWNNERYNIIKQLKISKFHFDGQICLISILSINCHFWWSLNIWLSICYLLIWKTVYYTFKMVSYDRFLFDGQNGFLSIFQNSLKLWTLQHYNTKNSWNCWKYRNLILTVKFVFYRNDHFSSKTPVQT